MAVEWLSPEGPHSITQPIQARSPAVMARRGSFLLRGPTIFFCGYAPPLLTAREKLTNFVV